MYDRYKWNNLPQYLIHWSPNQIRSIYTILDRSPFRVYSLFSPKANIVRFCTRHFIAALLTQPPRCITKKLVIQSFRGFLNYIRSIMHKIIRKSSHWKLLYLSKQIKAFLILKLNRYDWNSDDNIHHSYVSPSNLIFYYSISVSIINMLYALKLQNIMQI